MVNDSPSTSTAIHLSRPRPFRRLFRGIDGCPEEARSGPYLTPVSCNFFRSPPLLPPRGKRMGESNKWALCFPPMCLYAAPRPGILPSSPPLPPSTEKEEDKPQATIATAAFLHLHPPLPLAPSFSLIRAQREGRVAKSERAQIRPSR